MGSLGRRERHPADRATDSDAGSASGGRGEHSRISRRSRHRRVNGIRSRWLRCRLLTPVSAGTAPAQGMVRAAQLPLLAGIRLSAAIDRAGLVARCRICEWSGGRRRRGISAVRRQAEDRRRLLPRIARSARPARRRDHVDITLVNPVPRRPPGSTPAALGRSAAQVGGLERSDVGAARHDDAERRARAAARSWTTARRSRKSKPVTFTLPQSLAPTTVNGVESNWIRVQIVAGNYGVDASVRGRHDAAERVQARFVDVRAAAGERARAVVRRHHAAVGARCGGRVQQRAIPGHRAARCDWGRAAPFAGLPSQPPALYAAFTLPPARKSFPEPHGESVSRRAAAAIRREGDPAVSGAQRADRPPPAARSSHHFTLTNTSGDSRAL